jgi:hypothetical protein
MSADPYYLVQADGSAYGPHCADCFEQAERRARWYAARSNCRYQIVQTTPASGPRGRSQSEVVAVVGRDALGRIWTDVMTMDGLI